MDKRRPINLGGRPVTVEGGKKVQVYLSAKTLEDLDTLKAAMDCSRSEVVRRLVRGSVSRMGALDG